MRLAFDDLAAILCRQKRGGFLKPRYGSGAGGIMAVRYNHRRDEWVAYTTMSWEGGRVCNAETYLQADEPERDCHIGGRGHTVWGCP